MTASALCVVGQDYEEASVQTRKPLRRPADRPMSRDDLMRKANLALERLNRTDPKEHPEDRDWLYDQREAYNDLHTRVAGDLNTVHGMPYTGAESDFFAAIVRGRDRVNRVFSKFDFMGL